MPLQKWPALTLFAVLLSAAVLLAPTPAEAAVTSLDAWANLLTNTSPNTISYTTTTTSTLTMSAGTNRVALVGVCLETAAATTISTIDVRLDSNTGTQFTQVVRSTVLQDEQCYLGRLLDAQFVNGTHPVYLNVTLAASRITGVHIWAGTYQGVDQTTPVSSSVANNNAAVTVTFGGSGVTYNANSMTAYIVAGGNSATAVAHVGGFASAGTSWSTDQSTSMAQATNATSGSYAAGSTVTWTGSSARSAIAVASLNPVTVSPPGAPGTPTYSNIATTSVTVSWTAATGATSYNLQRATDSGFTLNLVTVNGVTSPYNDAGPLSANTTYWYRVVAVNAGGSTTGTGSSVLTLPGAAAAPTYASIAQTTLTVSWAAPTGGAASYNLQRATDSGFTTNLVTVNGVTSPYSATGLTANTTYWYRAVAVNASGSTTGSSSSVTTLPNPPGAPGTPTYSNIATTSVTVSWTAATGATSYNLQRATDSGFTLNLVTVNGVTSPYNDAGPLSANTTYWYRVVAVNAGGSTTGTGSSVTTLAPENRAIPGVPTGTANLCTQITVSAPYTGDANTNSSTTFARGTAVVGPFTNVTGCVSLTGVSPRQCIDSTVAASTTYYYQVTFTDVDGVVGTNPQVTAAVTTPACGANNTTIGTITAANASCNSVNAAATFTGDANNSGTTTFEYNTSNTWPGTASCTVSGPSPRVCTITGLTSPNTYWVRATFADADGVVGLNPTAGVSTGAALPACGADTMPPTVTVLSPARNAVIGGTETVKVQAFDAVAMAATPVLYSVDGAVLSATGVTVSGNYNCDDSSAPGKCKVYLFSINTTALTNGPHYFTVQAVDSSNNKTTLSWGFRVNNSGTAAAGTGEILRRTKSSQLCQDCHALETHSSQYTSTGYGNWSLDCLACHTPHATTNIYLVRPKIDTPNSGQKDVAFRNTTGVAANSFGTPQVSGNGVNVCEVCHTKTKNSDTTARARNNAATDWTKHYTGDCRSCHSHASGFKGGGESGGNDDCLGCHQFGMAVSDSAKTATYHHVMEAGNNRPAGLTVYPTSGTPTLSTADYDKTCVQCHADHNVFRPDKNASNTLGRGANLRSRIGNGPPTGNPPAPSAPGDTSAGYYTNRDADGTFAAGGICLSCHLSAQAKNIIDQKTYTGDPGQTTAIVAAAGDFSGSAHAFTVGGQITNGPSSFSVACVKCHSSGSTQYQNGAYKFDLHTSTNRRMLNPLGITAPVDPLGQNLCFRCHSRSTDTTPGGGPAKTVANRDYYNQADMSAGAQLLFNEFTTASASSHPVLAAGAGALHDPVEGTVVADGSLSGLNRHVQCEDCHSPHSALRPDDTGTATTATATSLTDSAKSGKWITNQWTGYKLVITSGTGAGQTQTVTSSTTTGTLNVASWNAAAGTPVVGSGYRVSRQGDNAVSGATKGVRGVTVTPGTVTHVGTATFKDGTNTVFSGASGGIVTIASTGTTVTAGTMNWTANQWNTYVMRVVTGLQAGQTRNITANAQATLTISATITLEAGDLFVIAKSTGTDTPVWTAGMVGGHLRNELDRDGRWYRIAAIATVDATNRVYSATITPAYGSGAFGSASVLSDTKMTSNATTPTAQWYMDYGTLYSISSVTLAATTSATKEYEICLKCHSSWALDFGSSSTATGGPPNVPSGHQDGAAVTETNVVLDFNNGQLSYHPVFAAGANQPTGVPYSGWNANAAYTRVDNTGSSVSFGLSNAFTTGWFKESLLQCSDCHASDTPSDPLGPHASGKKWILRGLDTTVSWVRRTSTGTAWETITNNQMPTPATETKNFCLNCHRWDVYGYIGLRGNAPASPLSRVPHDVTGNSNTYSSTSLPRSGIICNQCHGGDRIGGAHGSSRRKYPFKYDPSTSSSTTITAVPASYSGKRLLNGAFWYGVTRATTSTAVACWGKAGTDTVSLCAHGHENSTGNAAQYSYDDAADP